MHLAKLALAMSVLFMAARVLTSDNNLDLLPLTLGVTLIFGLPALRGVQPGCHSRRSRGRRAEGCAWF
jgi:hypothetical protein